MDTLPACKERVLAIGSPIPLAAVSSEPAQFDPALPVLLILNSGVMHHVGACRLSVKVARMAAAAGLLAVRFDFSGIGDSQPRPLDNAAPDQTMAELTEVMDYLQRQRGVQRFITFGLCSGAINGINIAARDERVVGVIQIDGFCYQTWRYHLEYYRPRLFSRERWASFLRRQWQRLLGRYQPPSASDSAGIAAEYLEVPDFDERPPRQQVVAKLQALVARRVKLCTLFTGGEPNYLYREQYRDCFPEVAFGDLLRLDYYPAANHIITQPVYQQAVLTEVGDWLQQFTVDSSADQGAVVTGQAIGPA